MLAVVSPAKKMNFDPIDNDRAFSQSSFMPETEKLMKTTRKLTALKIKRLMKLSDDLANLNYKRFQGMSVPFTQDNAKQAAFAFAGDTYIGLEASSLSNEDLDYAQSHLRILSGFYGLIRPLDLIQPYRLEMGIGLTNPRGSDLYDFWKDRIAVGVNDALKDHQHPVLINLASNEYFKAVKRKKLAVRVITPVFKEVKSDIAKVIGFSAKRARGMMARYIIQNRIENPLDLKKFNMAGYEFKPLLSTENEYQFHRVIEP